MKADSNLHKQFVVNLLAERKMQLFWKFSQNGSFLFKNKLGTSLPGK